MIHLTSSDLTQSAQVTNIASDNTWRYSVSNANTSTASLIGFDNEYYDAPTSLYYMSNRFYDPGTGQFLTQDPRILATGIDYGYSSITNPTTGGQLILDPTQINQTQIYQFANNDPVNLVDRSGLCPSRNCISNINPVPPGNYFDVFAARLAATELAFALGAATLALAPLAFVVALPTVMLLFGAGGFLTGLGAGLMYKTCLED